jgi:cytidyltransferase-like protein
MLGHKGASVTKIKQQIPKENKELRNRVGELVSQSKNILKSAIIPLEDIVHDFSVEMLRNLESAFIIDNKNEIKRLKGEVAGAIKAIENSGNEEAMSILQKQMEKLKSVENVSTASEGFVFDYDGNTYKFTGNFAPVNQILGLFKYGRGNVPPLQIKEEEIEIVDDRADIALLPGSFKPPHRGHLSLAQEYSKIADKLIILISDPQKSPRTLPSGDIITPEMSKEIWEIYLSNAGIHNAEAIVSPAPSPIGAVYGYLEELASSSDPIKVILGTSTKGGDDKEKYSAISKYQGTNLDVSSSPLPPLETEQGEIHASDMRKVVDELDIDALEKSFLPSGVSGEEIINIIKSQNPDPFKLDAPEEELEEISVMGAGAAAVGPGAIGKRDEDKYMIQREEIIQEISFRKMIRERIKQSMKKSKKPHIIYINERQKKMLDEAHLELVLRRNIRKIIMEASSEVPDYGSTAKNELAALLKQIIPIMEEDYMKLQTSEEQRESFRSHLIVFTIDALNAIKSNESGPETEEEEIEEDINLKVDSPDSDKFIDIGMDDEEEIEVSDEEEEEEGSALRTLSGHDKTGRNFAVRTFDKINSQIEDTYKALEDPSDESEFYDHLITNFKMYFDNFEGKLHAAPEEPTTDRYEKQKTSEEEPVDMSADEEVPEEAPEDLEAPPEEETLQEKAPPGFSEKEMMQLKKQYPGGEDKAFATAWTIHNKKK